MIGWMRRCRAARGRAWARSVPWRPFRGSTLAAVLVAASLAASSAGAVTMAPFAGPFAYGFDNDVLQRDVDWDIDADDFAWLQAGDNRIAGSESFSLTFDGAGVYTPMGDEAFEVEVTWTIQNPNPDAFTRVLLFFATLDAEDPYDPTRVGIDLDFNAEDLDVIRYTAGGFEYHFAGFAIDFAPGSGPAMRSYRLLVDQPLIENTTPIVATAAFFVPEPATALLVLVALAGLAVRRRRRC
jgi:hypothetical protein